MQGVSERARLGLGVRLAWCTWSTEYHPCEVRLCSARRGQSRRWRNTRSLRCQSSLPCRAEPWSGPVKRRRRCQSQIGCRSTAFANPRNHPPTCPAFSSACGPSSSYCGGGEHDSRRVPNLFQADVKRGARFWCGTPECRCPSASCFHPSASLPLHGKPRVWVPNGRLLSLEPISCLRSTSFACGHSLR